MTRQEEIISEYLDEKTRGYCKPRVKSKWAEKVEALRNFEPPKVVDTSFSDMRVLTIHDNNIKIV
jgi:hypothetical protein